MNDAQSLPTVLMLGALEALLNQAVAANPSQLPRLRSLHGCVVRLRLERPSFSLYVLVAEDGIEFLPDYEGHVDVRIRTQLGPLVQWFLLPQSTIGDHPALRITGDEKRLETLYLLLDELKIWSVLRQWFEQHIRLGKVLEILKREDPSWLAKLDALQEQLQSIGYEQARQRLIQEEILEALKELPRELQRQRRRDTLWITSGLLLLLAAFATALGLIPVAHFPEGWNFRPDNLQTWILATSGFTLILSRLVWPQSPTKY